MSAARGYATLAEAIKGRFAELFGTNPKGERLSTLDHPAARLAATNERGFLQRVMINQRYALNCNRLSLWEYLLILEHTEKQDK